MLAITKDNAAEYVASRLDFFNRDGDIVVSAVGEGSLEEDGDGFINYIFRVSDGEHRLIVKQMRSAPRFGGEGLRVDSDRYRLEYRTMQIRHSIVPDLVPAVYDCDDENRTIITEDVSHLKISRFQLIKGVRYPRLADQIARYMAATEFYTSEYYLDNTSFRNLSVYFTNSTMRQIMDIGMFLTSVVPEDTVGRSMDPAFEPFARKVCADPAVLLARQKLRHLFMSKGECLIHGDLHTSNVFASEDECKVIDMEYTFCGPFSYDLGYFLANFISQYECAVFRTFPSEEERKSYKDYCLFMIRETYTRFCDYVCHYCDEDSKPEYHNIPGYQEDFRLTVLREFIGFAASAQLGRIAGDVPYPDYDEIEDDLQRHNAKCLSIIICGVFLTKWESYQTIDDIIEDMTNCEEIYLRHI